MSRNTAKDETSHSEWLFEVFAAARNGTVANLHNLLENKSAADINEALNSFTEEDGLKATPLIVAARYGHNNIIKELLNKYKVYKEQSGILEIDGEVLEGATALWCAVAFNNIDTVSTLLSLGADINTVCPLRPAVYEGNLDMVKLLVENKAMVNIPSRYHNNTCLMLAAGRNNNSDIVTYLLENGANIHAKDQEGKNVLHHAAEKGNFEIVRTLIEARAAHVKDHARITPVQIACMNQNEVAAKYIIDHVELSSLDEIEALELLGACFQDSFDSFENVYNYLLKGMEMRHFDSSNVKKKLEVGALPEYGNREELQTVEGLKQIENNQLELNFQALLTKERILGEDNEFVQDSIVYVAGLLADNKKWPEALSLLTRTIELKIRNNYRASYTFFYLYKFLTVMIDSNEPPYAYQLVQLIEKCLEEIKLEQKRFVHAPLLAEKNESKKALESTVLAFLHLQTIVLKLERTTPIDNDLYSVMRTFNELELYVYGKNGSRTPLHMLCSEAFEVDPCLFEETVLAPHPGVLKLMFMNGVKPDVSDDNGNTPLHLIFENQLALSDKRVLKETVDLFFQSGAQLDRMNKEGKRPLDLCSSKMVKYLKDEFRKTRYKTFFNNI